MSYRNRFDSTLGGKALQLFLYKLFFIIPIRMKTKAFWTRKTWLRHETCKRMNQMYDFCSSTQSTKTVFQKFKKHTGKTMRTFYGEEHSNKFWMNRKMFHHCIRSYFVRIVPYNGKSLKLSMFSVNVDTFSTKSTQRLFFAW